MNTNILLAGVGGQGIIFASKLLTQAALNTGLEVRSAETIGMAQRGGSVVSHVRLGGQLTDPNRCPLYAPLITPKTANLIVAFELQEAQRALPYLKEGGVLITADMLLLPAGFPRAEAAALKDAVKDYLAAHEAHILPVQAALTDLDSTRALNVLLLGAALQSGAAALELAQIEAVLATREPASLHTLNLRALKCGADLMLTHPTTEE